MSDSGAEKSICQVALHRGDAVGDLRTNFLEIVGARPSGYHAAVDVSVIWTTTMEKCRSRYPACMCPTLRTASGGRGLSIYLFLLPNTAC